MPICQCKMISGRRVNALQENLIFILTISRKLIHEKISLKDNELFPQAVQNHNPSHFNSQGNAK